MYTDEHVVAESYIFEVIFFEEKNLMSVSLPKTDFCHNLIFVYAGNRLSREI